MQNQEPLIDFGTCNAKYRMICFPYAGGSANVFYDWQKHLPEEIAVIAFEPAGRGRRSMESVIDQMPKLIDSLVDDLLPWLDRPFMLFGHSLGAKVGFEVCRTLKARCQKQAQAMIISGSAAPQLARKKPWIHQMPDQVFIQELRRLNGTPEAVLASEDLVRYFLPMLRADFKIAETYQFSENESLAIPLYLFSGLEDEDVQVNDILPWRQFFENYQWHRAFQGGHFFLQEQEQDLLSAIRQVICEQFDLRSATNNYLTVST